MQCVAWCSLTWLHSICCFFFLFPVCIVAVALHHMCLLMFVHVSTISGSETVFPSHLGCCWVFAALTGQCGDCVCSESLWASVPALCSFSPAGQSGAWLNSFLNFGLERLRCVLWFVPRGPSIACASSSKAGLGASSCRIILNELHL